jgi:hypothetical protein
MQRFRFLVTRGILPRSILLPLSSSTRSGFLSHTPPTPLRHDMMLPTRTSLPFTGNNNFVGDLTSSIRLINTSKSNEKENERIYLNQLNSEQIAESHPYDSIDIDDNNDDERVSTHVQCRSIRSLFDCVLL